MPSRNEACVRLAEYHEQERRFCKETVEQFRTSSCSGHCPQEEEDWLAEMIQTYSLLESQHLFYREMFFERLRQSSFGPAALSA